MRIIHCFRSPVGGIFRHVRDLTGQQARDGHEVGIICDSLTGGAYEDRLFEAFMPELALGLHRLPMPRSIGPRDSIALWKTSSIVRKLNPDIVRTHGAKGGIYGRMAATLFNANCGRFYCPHGGAMHYDPATLKGKLFFSVERFMERFTDSLIFVSEYEKNAYSEKVGAPTCNVGIAYNGLAEDEFDPIPATKNNVDFLYIGMMRDLKGPDVFLDALAAIRNRGKEQISAWFVGDGPDKPAYVEKIRRLGLSDVVSVHDAMPARDAFAAANTVIVPSRAESMPYIVLEAIAAAKPVIATNVGGIPEIFSERREKLVEPGNVEALAEAMSNALEDPNIYKDAVEFANELKSRFSLTAMAKMVDEIYSQRKNA